MNDFCAILTVAGSDSGGGAGIQADLKTFSAMGVFGTSVITAVTAQNLDGVTAIQPIHVAVVRKQLIAVLEGFPIKAIKTGMLFSAKIIDEIVSILSQDRYCSIPLVIDPVFAATSGSKLIRDEAIHRLKNKFFPLATLITPNMPEAEILTGLTLKTVADLEKAARLMYKKFGVAVLLKGGHLQDKSVYQSVDILYDREGMRVYEAEWFSGVNTHGSGCTLSSAIAAALARGESLREAINSAKNYINSSLRFSLPLTPDLRVINHFPQP